MIKTYLKHIRFGMLTVAASAAVMVCAAPASAIEMTGTNPDYTNGRCQSYIGDADCYHYAGKYTTHQGCLNKLGAILGVNPKSAYGKFWIGKMTFMCKAGPPEGYYRLDVWVGSPPCKVGAPFSECPKG